MAKKSTPNRKYTPEFKADVLRLVANGEPILAVAKKMGISDSIIHAWRAADKKNKGEEKSTSTLQEEVESLKRQLRWSYKSGHETYFNFVSNGKKINSKPKVYS